MNFGLTMLDPTLSLRGGTTVSSLNRPWRFASKPTYHPDTNAGGLISFGMAENHLVTDDVAKFVIENFKPTSDLFLYRGASAEISGFTEVLADHVNEYLKPEKTILAEHVRVSNCATAMHDVLAWALADSRDAFLVSRPSYGRLELDFFNRAGVKVEYADTTPQNCFDEDVVVKFEAAVEDCASRGVKVKALFIINPHNPLGKCYPKQTLINILDFCEKHRIHLISDEIYACSVFDSGEEDAVPFTSILSLPVDKHIDPSRLHVIYGLSKDFGSAGLRLGAVITRNGGVLAAIDAVTRFSSASAPSLAMGKVMLSDREWCRSFVDGNREKLAAAYKHATTALREIGVDYIRGGNAGFFVYIDLSPFLPDHRVPEFQLAEMLQKAGVFLHPCEEHAPQPGWFRLVFSQDPRHVTEGIKRIQSVISKSK